jgi:hypothetical protein
MAFNKLAVDSLNLAGKRILIRLVSTFLYYIPDISPCTVILYDTSMCLYFNLKQFSEWILMFL